jgi:Ran GTPase-activating protein (RanGAP) involved in mRNA processing and transport
VTESDPTPVRCPAPIEPTTSTVDLAPLLARLADPAPVTGALRFPRGTLQPDGRLDLCKQALDSRDVRRVIDAAVTSAHARHLLLGTNSLGAAGVAALAEALGDGHQVRTLYLGCNHVDAAAVAPLARRLADDRTVKALWLKRNPIGDAGVRTVAAALAANATVRTLDLTNTGMTAAGLRVLVDALVGRPVPAERLYLGGNNLGPEAAPLLARLLRDAGVAELYLNAGRLGDEGASTIADALPTGTRVVLGLGGNGIGPAGVRALATRLGLMSTLDLARPPSALTLRAVPNEVGDEGAAALAATLPGSGLRRLDLRHTGVTGRGARLLVAALESTSDLELLGLGSGVPRRLKRQAADAMRPPTPPAEDIRAIASVYR